ncbi:RHS repeat-associated core domain-containing protein [Saccharopolyspora gregorii]|uniref:Teneurin-like YD-shell domain-containing protein n=1 Tax=Saccharopolyspora gregorii TaxID=33914 RepID=A0ABP6RUF1_9PSEU
MDQQFYSIITDLVGSPAELINDQGGVAWFHRTTLWGNTLDHSRTGAYTPLRFPGQYADPETGLNYNFHRHYDPSTGRYGSVDPLGLGGGTLPHSYVPNPHEWVDPLGLAPCDRLSPEQLKEHDRQVKKYGKDGFKELEDGRIRYYGKFRTPQSPGEMAGARTVREWNPETGQKRMWQETLDHNQTVRQARLDVSVTGGRKVHYTFDRDGNYTGSW